jgi:hypothetical protein
MERIIFNHRARKKNTILSHNAEKAVEDAEAIHNKGQGRWGPTRRESSKLFSRT